MDLLIVRKGYCLNLFIWSLSVPLAEFSSLEYRYLTRNEALNIAKDQYTDCT